MRKVSYTSNQLFVRCLGYSCQEAEDSQLRNPGGRRQIWKRKKQTPPPQDSTGVKFSGQSNKTEFEAPQATEEKCRILCPTSVPKNK